MSMFLCAKGVPRPPFKECGMKGHLSEVNTANPIFHIKEQMDGTNEAIFHKLMIALLDDVITYNSMKFLSIEQERFMHMFFKQAEEVTLAELNGEEDPFQNMSELMKQFDNFLGSYSGDNNE